jgi:hypothetical protein
VEAVAFDLLFWVYTFQNRRFKLLVMCNWLLEEPITRNA